MALNVRVVEAAADRLRGIANRTPVVTSRALNERVGAEIFLKCESFQRTGSFKFRGAFNALSVLDADQRAKGVLTYSSGNHAQAIALVGRLLDIPVTVVMPKSAPKVKRRATEGYGATVVEYDEAERSREEVAREIQGREGQTLIPPFDHPDVLAGQGTAALELLEEVGRLDTLYVPCGGGGLLSGSALAATRCDGCSVIGVEPEQADDAARTFRTGEIQTVRNPPTIADGLRTPSLGGHTWPIIKRHVAGFVTVSESEIVEATHWLWTRMKLVVEPSGAVSLAGMMKNEERDQGRRIGIIISGGNADLAAVLALLAETR